MSGNISFIKKQQQYETVDICVCVNQDNFEELLISLDQSGQNINLFLMDGNEHNNLENFIKNRSWSFNNISLWKDDNADRKSGEVTELYDWLIRQGNSKYVGYLSCGNTVNNHFYYGSVLPLVNNDKFACTAIGSILQDSDELYPYTCVGFASLHYAVFQRVWYDKLGGFDTDLEFGIARQDLALKVILQTPKEIMYVNTNLAHAKRMTLSSLYSDDVMESSMVTKWSYRFPEKKFLPIKSFPGYDFDISKDYHDRVKKGYDIMSKSSVVIVGLARDIGYQLKTWTLPRLDYLGSLFKKQTFIIYENDSEDDTVDVLKNWARGDPDKAIFLEELGRERLKGRETERVERMAEYRNNCLDVIEENYKDFDYYIPIDLDLVGGFSYDGIAHSIGTDFIDWDFIGSNGKNSHKNTVLFWDTFPYRDLGNNNMSISGREMYSCNRKYAELQRGESLIEVNSCFGGAAVYKLSSLLGCKYSGVSSEHVSFHRCIKNKGGKGYINPSQIVLYNYLYWCEDQTGKSFRL